MTGATAFAAPAADAATYTVTTLADNVATPPAGSLREAIEDANANVGVDDDIVFQSGLTGQISLDLAQLQITDGVSIQGPGAGPGGIIVSGQGQSRVFLIDLGGVGPRDTRGGGSGQVSLAGLSIVDGFVYGSVGGGVLNGDADVTIESSEVTGNQILSPDLLFGTGAGVFSNGPSLTISNSTISGNYVAYYDGGTRGNVGGDYAGVGGGVHLTPNTDAVLSNSTISGNAARNGGGIGLEGGGSPVDINNSTIADNEAEVDGGGVYSKYAGGRGAAAQISLLSTIVGDNIAPGDSDFSANVVSAGFSLIEDTSATINTTGPNILGVDPQLGNLFDNGGTTRTHLPAITSPVLDQGIANGLTTDQRGSPRTLDDAAIANAAGGDSTDIGSVEASGGSPPSTLVTPAPTTPPAGRQCLGVPATIIGTTGKDIITGTEERDVIRGLLGNDVIKSLGGDDLVCGDKGNDKIRSGEGDDTARGGNGDDKIKGGTGNDILRGGSGVDGVFGEDGDDQLFGGAPKGKSAGGGVAGGGPSNLCSGGSGTDSASGCDTVTGVP